MCRTKRVITIKANKPKEVVLNPSHDKSPLRP